MLILLPLLLQLGSFQAPDIVRAESVPAPSPVYVCEWDLVYTVRISYLGPNPDDARAQWSVITREIGPETEDRAPAEALRANVLANGLTWLEGGPDGSDFHIAAANMLFTSVKLACCDMSTPPPFRPRCNYPDGEPPPNI